MDDQKILLLVLLILTLAVLSTALVVIVFLFFKLRQLAPAEKIPAQPLPKKKAAIPSLASHCHQHQDKNAIGICSICEASCCDECLREIEHLHFCPEHIRLYVEHSWVPISNVKTTPESPEDGIYIYEFKGRLWDKERIPTFIVTHYKINIDNDFIESYVQLFVREEQEDELQRRLDQYRGARVDKSSGTFENFN
jgi:hypothetical protein